MGSIWRLPRVSAQLCRGRSALYDDVRKGLLTPPIKIGVRAVGWLAPEVLAVIDARIAGRSDAEIKALVKRMLVERTSPDRPPFSADYAQLTIPNRRALRGARGRR